MADRAARPSTPRSSRTRSRASRHDSPELLLERWRGGDDDAFRRLAERCGDGLYAFLARMTGDGRLAEGAFRKTLAVVAGDADSFDGRAPFGVRLYGIARNAALDELRRRADSRLPPGDAVTAALAALPEARREAFLLKEECGLDFAGIGCILGCGGETAKSRFRLAAEQLRDAFGPPGPPGRNGHA